MCFLITYVSKHVDLNMVFNMALNIALNMDMIIIELFVIFFIIKANHTFVFFMDTDLDDGLDMDVEVKPSTRVFNGLVEIQFTKINNMYFLLKKSRTQSKVSSISF